MTERATTPSEKPLNAVNRGVYISDNPPLAKNEPFGSRKGGQKLDPLKLPLSDKEKATKLALLRCSGIRSPQPCDVGGHRLAGDGLQ